MIRKTLVSLLALAPLTQVDARGIDFRLSGDTAEFVYLTESATFGYGGADMGFGAFINENDDIIGSASILVSGANAGDVRSLHFGVGAKVYGGIVKLPSPLDNQSGGALAIGGQVRYVFPASMPFAIVAEAFAAPDVTSLSDFEGMKEFRAAVEVEVTPSARAYLGYRFLEVELNNGVDIELDDNVHVGVRFSF